jgi:hypothetical protein
MDWNLFKPEVLLKPAARHDTKRKENEHNAHAKNTLAVLMLLTAATIATGLANTASTPARLGADRTDNRRLKGGLVYFRT